MSIGNSSSRSPRVSTKGSTIVHTGTTTAEIAIGSNSTYLIANSSASVGVNWATTDAFAIPKFEVIYSTTTTTTISSVDITGIAQTYEGLFIEISNSTTTHTTASEISIFFNSSSASYYYIANSSDSSTASIGRARNGTDGIKVSYTVGGSSDTAVISNGNPGLASVSIPGYRTNKAKSVTFTSRASSYVTSGCGTWKSTDAINRILINFPNYGGSGTKITLYATSI